MSFSQLGLDPLTIIFIIIFSFIFDLVDLGSEEEIHSYRFVFSTVYGIYLIFRVFFGLAAALILKSTGIVSDPLLLSIFSVIASASILQNFSLKIGGTQPVNINDLFQQYRDKIVVVVGQKEESRLRESKLQIEIKLAEEESKKLQQILTLIIADFGKKEEWRKIKEEYLTYADAISEGDEEIKNHILARIIASLDPLYAGYILKKKKNKKS